MYFGISVFVLTFLSLYFFSQLQAGHIIDIRSMINDATRLNVEEGSGAVGPGQPGDVCTPFISYATSYLLNIYISYTLLYAINVKYFCVFSGPFAETSWWLHWLYI